MTQPAAHAGRDRSLDPDLAKALSSPLRQRILEWLSVSGEASPNQLSHALDAPLGNVAYHVRTLERLGLVELAGTRQRRGAVEHHYRALAHPWLDPEQWALLPTAFRRQALARTLRDIVARASDAGVAGGFDHPDAQIRHASLQLDEQGWGDAAELLDQTFAALQRIHDDSAARTAERRLGRPGIDAEVGLLFFRRPPEQA